SRPARPPSRRYRQSFRNLRRRLLPPPFGLPKRQVQNRLCYRDFQSLLNGGSVSRSHLRLLSFLLFSPCWCLQCRGRFPKSSKTLQVPLLTPQNSPTIIVMGIRIRSSLPRMIRTPLRRLPHFRRYLVRYPSGTRLEQPS